MPELKTALVLIVALLGYPLVGLLALNSDVAGWTSSDGPMRVVWLMFVVPVCLAAITALLGGLRLATSALLAVGTLAACFVLLFVLLVMASNSGALS